MSVFDLLGELAAASGTLDLERVGNAVAKMAATPRAPARAGAPADEKPRDPATEGCGFEEPGIGRCVAHVDGQCTLEKGTR